MQEKLITEKGYAPYCGRCSSWSRAVFNGNQFVCKFCGWKSVYPVEFITRYKAKWGK